MRSRAGSTCVPNIAILSPLTDTRPSRIRPSPARREATPASERNFCRRIGSKNCQAGNAQAASAPESAPPRARFRTSEKGSGLRLGLAQAGDAVALFPLAPFLDHFDAFKALKDIAFSAQGRCRAQTSML